MNAGIGVLLVVTGTVLAGFLWFIASIVRRARMAPIVEETLT
jgi:hypothetical protein